MAARDSLSRAPPATSPASTARFSAASIAPPPTRASRAGFGRQAEAVERIEGVGGTLDVADCFAAVAASATRRASQRLSSRAIERSCRPPPSRAPAIAAPESAFFRSSCSRSNSGASGRMAVGAAVGLLLALCSEPRLGQRDLAILRVERTELEVDRPCGLIREREGAAGVGLALAEQRVLPAEPSVVRADDEVRGGQPVLKNDRPSHQQFRQRRR